MQRMFLIVFLLLFSLSGLTGCTDESKTAMVDVNAIIKSGMHAQAAAKHMKDSQEIYQYNLNIIEKILSQYKNKAQARAYLIEAARQLQTQLNNSKLMTTQALLNALNVVLAEQKKEYDLIIKKDGIIYRKSGDVKGLPEDITMKVQALYTNTAVTFPQLPRVVQNPNLPADLGEGVAFPPKADAGAAKQ